MTQIYILVSAPSCARSTAPIFARTQLLTIVGWSSVTGGKADRLDGIAQPPDITKKIQVHRCQTSPTSGYFRVTKVLGCTDKVDFTDDAA